MPGCCCIRRRTLAPTLTLIRRRILTLTLTLNLHLKLKRRYRNPMVLTGGCVLVAKDEAQQLIGMCSVSVCVAASAMVALPKTIHQESWASAYRISRLAAMVFPGYLMYVLSEDQLRSAITSVRGIMSPINNLIIPCPNPNR